jgi:multidrug efflux system membrane fusion protein
MLRHISGVKQMQKRNKWLIFGIMNIALWSFVWISMGKQQGNTANQSLPVAVSIAKVVQQDVTVPLQVIGTVQAYSVINVQSQVSGQVLKVGFQQGEYVKQGQLLFQIDPRPYQAALQQAKANLARDQANLESAKLQVQRNAPLVKQNYLDQQTFDNYVATEQADKAIVAADQAAIESAQLQLDYANITAPIAGRTGSLQVYPGNVVTAGSSAILVTITQINPIYVQFSVPQQYLASIRQQLAKGAVSVTANLDGKMEQGELSFVDNTVDTDTGSIQLKATFANTDHSLWPGQFVTVSLPTANLSNALVIPSAAVQMGQNGAYVYVLATDNTVNYRAITLGPVVGNNTIILSGLKPNEQVVTAGQLRLSNGSTVKVISS